jgi:nucleoside-diphosphate-sugar epimerase
VRVAVIGSTGFIGQHVARWLTAGGHEVFGIQRGSSSTQIPGIRNLIADHQVLPALASALVQAAPTVVVDMVAYTADDTDRLTAALPATVRRLIIVSSGDVYWTYDAFRGFGDPGAVAEPLPESAPLRERLFPYRQQASGPGDLLYSYEKILVEQRARVGSPVPITVLRLPMVFGPRDPNRRVGGYLQRLATESSPLRLNPAEAQWRCTRGYVEDVAWAIALAAGNDRAAGQVYNVGEAEALTERAWAEAIAQAAGWPGQVVADPSAPPSLPANWSVPLTVDTRHIRAHLGYEEPIGRAVGLRRTVQAAADASAAGA